jgi:hypothetical protein
MQLRDHPPGAKKKQAAQGFRVLSLTDAAKMIMGTG